MSVAIIINPIAGGTGRAASVGARVDLARSVAAACKELADVHVTEESGHAAQLARAARAGGARLVVAWGGDGTVNEVASALAFGDVPIGIVPARIRQRACEHVGMLVCRRSRHGRPRTPHLIDAGEIGASLRQLAGIGFDGARRGALQRSENLAPRARRLPRSSRERRLPLRAGPLHHRHDRLPAIARCMARRPRANGTEFGTASASRRTRVDDGALDLVVVEQDSRLPLCGHAAHRDRTVEQAAQWSSTLVQRVKIESDTPMMFHVDGEPVQGGTTLDALVHPAR